ncbi:glycosyltransferase family 4 protein [Candidatus Latescibacterota bacterium]
MKKSLLLTSDFPPVIGGIGNVFYHMWKYYPQDRMLVMTPHFDGDREFDKNALVQPIRFYPKRKGIISKFLAMTVMSKLAVFYVLFRSVREIHAGQLLTCGPVGYFLQRVFGMPCFLWLYGGEAGSNYTDSPLKRRLASFLLRRCTWLVTNSPTTTREFIDFGISRDRIIEIIPAVDTELFTPGPKPEHLLKKYDLEGKKLLVTVGRLVERKGHDLVLRTLSMMKSHPDLHYVIAGSGPDLERLESLALELGVDERVTFLGRVDESELADCYRLSDIFVMPNRMIAGRPDSIEGFGMTFIEANACGRPVIGGRSGGALDAVEDGVTGYLIDPEVSSDLEEKIVYLLDNPNIAKEMGRRGRERAAMDYTWEKRAGQLSRYLSIKDQRHS